MKKIQVCQLSLLILISMSAGLLFSNDAGAVSHKEWVAEVFSVQGNVQAKRKDETQWKPVKLNETYHIGDMIKVQERSRAAILISNETITACAKPSKKLSVTPINGVARTIGRRIKDEHAMAVNRQVDGVIR